MKVIIQLPSVLGPFSYVEKVYDVTLQPAKQWPGWFRIMALSPSEETGRGYPYLHKGFFDAHLHMTWKGQVSGAADLRSTRDMNEALVRVRELVKDSRECVRAYGWDETRWGCLREVWEEAFLREIPQDRPLILYRVCGHAALVSRALKRKAGLESPGAWVDDADLKGLHTILPAPTVAECREAFLVAQKTLLSQGISTVGDMALDETTALAITEIARSGELEIDVQGVLESGQAPSWEARGPQFSRNADRNGLWGRPAEFKIQHWKKFLDGSLGSRTAWLSEDYHDASGVRGLSLIKDDDALMVEAEAALKEGFLLSFHAIGDAALDQALRVGQRLRSWMERRQREFNLRHRLEHVQVVRPDQLTTLREQDLWCVVIQPGHREADRAFIDQRLGSQRLKQWAYRAESFRKAEIPLALSSDTPVDSEDPLHVIAAQAHHAHAQERMSRTDAMWWYTTGARRILGMDVGRIEVGEYVWLTEVKES